MSRAWICFAALSVIFTGLGIAALVDGATGEGVSILCNSALVASLAVAVKWWKT